MARRQWVNYETLDFDTDDFGAIGDAFDEAHPLKLSILIRPRCAFLRQRPLVDFAVNWMEQHRDFTV